MAALTVCAALSPGPAGAAQLVGTDVPSCRPPAVDAAFVVVPVNAGRAFTANPCLAAQAAGLRQVQLFVNGADPGPGATHWPGGGCASAHTPSCAQLYGEAVATDAIATVRASGAQLLPRIWWVDIETLNTWTGTHAANLASIRGTVQALRSRPDLVSAVGIYSSRQQWHDITGDDRSMTVPQWSGTPMATQAQAEDNCSSTASFTQGPVVMTQFARPDGADGDVVCPPRLGSHAPARSGESLLVQGSALPGSVVTVESHEPDRTIRRQHVTTPSSGTWQARVRLRFTGTIQLATAAGLRRGIVAVAPALPLSVSTGRCVVSASGTVTPHYPGQQVQVVVSGGRSATVGTGATGFWHARVPQPCGALVSVQARITGVDGRTRWVSAARSRSVIVRV